jgi:PAS domain S-box-containing protein
MNPQVQKPPRPWPMIILMLIIMAATTIAGITYYRYQKNNLLSENLQELSSISDLKIRQITQWRLERLADASFIEENIMLWLGKYFEDTAYVTDDKIVLKILKSLTENYDYRSAMLIARDGSLRMAFPVADTQGISKLRMLFPGIAEGHRAVLADIYMNRQEQVIFPDLIIPLFEEDKNDSPVPGFLVLRIDPEKVLYPLLRLWPAPSKSAETLIIKKEGDEVVYFNKPRLFKGGEAVSMNHRIVTGEHRTEEMIFNGIRETIDGTDYRNVRVIASMKKIPGTSWYMIAKIDRAEVISILRSQMRLVITALVLIMATIMLFLGFIVWTQRIRFYREKYEEELNRLALFKHFNYILKFANDIIFLFDHDLNIEEANDRTLEAYGYSRDQLIGMNISKLQAPGTMQHVMEQISGMADSGTATFETVHLRKDGTVFPVEISSRIVNIEGNVNYQIIGRDITERKLAEEILRESELRFRKIFEESPFPMVITAKDFGIIRANESFCRMTGYDEAELKQHTLGDLTHPEDTGDEPLNLMKLIAEDIPVYHNEKRYVKKDGSVILGSSTTSIIRNKKDEAEYFIWMVEDITQRKKAEQDLIAAKLKAEESDRLKTAFLHNVSHEIRTPMNAIIGFSSLLNETDVDQKERSQFTEIIFQSSNQLLSIINDIVDIANIESGQVKIHHEKTDLNFLLRSLDEQYSINEKQKTVPITISTGLPDEEAIIITDSTKLIQIISNLINNSVKFTKKGSIDFGYARKGDLLEFYVKDTGIGIPAESLSKIFDRFYQVDRTISRQFGGTGLGLSICKAFVELLGGTISVESEPDKGTTFIFSIPYNPAT